MVCSWLMPERMATRLALSDGLTELRSMAVSAVVILVPPMEKL